MRDERALCTWSLAAGSFTEASKVRREFIAFVQTCAHGPNSDVDGAHVIFGELIANALEHGTGTVTVSVHAAGNSLLLRVHDEGPGFQLTDAAPGVDSLRGRGLFFVRELARRVAVRSGESGTTVEAELPVETGFLESRRGERT